MYSLRHMYAPVTASRVDVRAKTGHSAVATHPARRGEFLLHVVLGTKQRSIASLPSAPDVQQTIAYNGSIIPQNCRFYLQHCIYPKRSERMTCLRHAVYTYGTDQEREKNNADPSSALPCVSVSAKHLIFKEKAAKILYIKGIRGLFSNSELIHQKRKQIPKYILNVLASVTGYLLFRPRPLLTFYQEPCMCSIFNIIYTIYIYISSSIIYRTLLYRIHTIIRPDAYILLLRKLNDSFLILSCWAVCNQQYRFKERLVGFVPFIYLF